MVGLVFLIALVLVGVGLLVTGVVLKGKTRSSGYGEKVPVMRWPYFAGGFVVLLVTGMIFTLSSFTQIGPSDVGIVTAFGHTVGDDLGPGIHFVPMWQGVTVWDDSVQHTQFDGNNCLQIRIAGQQAACLDVNIYWRATPAASDQQFRLYRTFGRMENAYFSQGVLVKYFNNVFEKFDPVSLASATAQGKKGGATVSGLTAQVEHNMRVAYQGTAYIVSLSTGSPKFSNEVETALGRVVTSKANYNVALQNKLTAQAQAAAAKSLAQNNSLTPAVVEQNCLNITQTIIQGNGSLPPAWTCTPGGSGVIVNGTTH